MPPTAIHGAELYSHPGVWKCHRCRAGFRQFEDYQYHTHSHTSRDENSKTECPVPGCRILLRHYEYFLQKATHIGCDAMMIAMRTNHDRFASRIRRLHDATWNGTSELSCENEAEPQPQTQEGELDPYRRSRFKFLFENAIVATVVQVPHNHHHHHHHHHHHQQILRYNYRILYKDDVSSDLKRRESCLCYNPRSLSVSGLKESRTSKASNSSFGAVVSKTNRHLKSNTGRNESNGKNIAVVVSRKQSIGTSS